MKQQKSLASEVGVVLDWGGGGGLSVIFSPFRPLRNVVPGFKTFYREYICTLYVALLILSNRRQWYIAGDDLYPDEPALHALHVGDRIIFFFIYILYLKK